jgi:ABC-2 type transport system permease protein
MRRAVYAEWTKLRTVAAPAGLALTAIVVTIVISVLVTASVSANSGANQDPVKLALTGVDVGQAVIAGLAVLMVSGEYATGMIRTTLTAIPRRLTVLAAKASLLVAGTLVAGAVAVLLSLLLSRPLLQGNGFSPTHGFELVSMGDRFMLRAAGGTVLYLALVALLSLGIATIVRDAATGIGVILGLLYLFPLLTALVSDTNWQRRLEQIGPMSAGLAIQATTNVGAEPIGPWHGLGVLGLWAAGAMLAAIGVLMLRDA